MERRTLSSLRRAICVSSECVVSRTAILFEIMWAYVTYLHGKQQKEMYIEKEHAILIVGDKTKCLIEKNGKYYEGFILAEGESKEQLKAKIFEKKLRFGKRYPETFSAQKRPPVMKTKALFQPDEQKKNWKKRLITLAAQESESCEPLTSENTTMQINKSLLSSNKTLNDGVSDIQDYSTQTNEPWNDQTTDDLSKQLSPEFEPINQDIVDDFEGDYPAWISTKKKNDHELLSLLNSRICQVPSLDTSSDSESSNSDINQDSHNDLRNFDSRIHPKLIKFIDGVLKEKQRYKRKLNTVKQAMKQRKNKYKIQKVDFPNTVNDGLNTESSSIRRKYVQFNINHVYAPTPYSKTLENLLHKNNTDEAMEVLDSSVIEYMTSVSPLLHSTANISVFETDKVPREESFSAGINHDLYKLRNDFREFKQQIITSLDENTQRLKEYCKDLQTIKQNKALEIQEAVKSALPSKSLDAFLKLNDLLKESLPHREELKKMYRVIICGETSVKSCIRKIMQLTLSKAVESEYSGVGKKFRGVTKLNYSKTQTFQCLHDVLIEKFGLIPELKNLGGRVGQWLSSNADREGIQNMKTEKKTK